jgi:hypothetical protein
MPASLPERDTVNRALWRDIRVDHTIAGHTPPSFGSCLLSRRASRTDQVHRGLDRYAHIYGMR